MNRSGSCALTMEQHPDRLKYRASHDRGLCRCERGLRVRADNQTRPPTPIVKTTRTQCNAPPAAEGGGRSGWGGSADIVGAGSYRKGPDPGHDFADDQHSSGPGSASRAPLSPGSSPDHRQHPRELHHEPSTFRRMVQPPTSNGLLEVRPVHLDRDLRRRWGICSGIPNGEDDDYGPLLGPASQSWLRSSGSVVEGRSDTARGMKGFRLTVRTGFVGKLGRRKLALRSGQRFPSEPHFYLQVGQVPARRVNTRTATAP